MKKTSLATKPAINHSSYTIQVSPDDLVYPYYIIGGRKKRQSIKNLQGVYRFSIDEMIKDMGHLIQKGINKVFITGAIDDDSLVDKGKTDNSDKNLIAKAIKNIRKHYPKTLIFAQANHLSETVDSESTHQDELLSSGSSLANTTQLALSYAQAGADFVVSAAIEDGEIQAIRNVLFSNGCFSTKIVASSVRYPSAFYDIGACNPSIQFPSEIDAATCSMSEPKIVDTIQDIQTDLSEGASFIMVKSATGHLDVIYRLKQKYSSTPFMAFHLAGEYAAIKNAANAGLMNESAAFTEVLTALKRAGADYIVTYFKY